MIDLTNKTVTIVGAQKSGVALSRLVLRFKGRPKVTDQREENEFVGELIEQFRKENILLELGGHTQEFIEESDVLVLSPGVKIDSQCVQWAMNKRILVLGEIEFASQFCNKPIIAVTGSNGKTTVVHLIRDVIKATGKTPCLCGNVGFPFSEYVMNLKGIDYVVLEVSSFQMESLLAPETRPSFINGFKPAIAVLLNFNQNHLDRHKNLQEYFDAKKKIFLNQDSEDYAILNFNSDRMQGLKSELRSQVRFFNDPADWTEIVNPNHKAVMEVAKILGISQALCYQVFDHFSGVEHRMESIRTIEGVEYINDSKATTAEAVGWALNNTLKPIHLICGGKDKNIDFSILNDLVRRKVKKIFAIGEAQHKVKATFESIVAIEECSDLQDAVMRARTNAVSGDCVLLSPMCASFDMFANFEERGKVFKEIINSLN